MDFSENDKKTIAMKANGQCECTRTVCMHSGRCQNRLSPIAVLLGLYAGFEFNHLVAKAVGGQGVPSNGELLCKSCHLNTRSYGRHA